MHEVLVNRLGGLSLARKSVVRLTDRPDMTLDVYRGRKTTIQQQLGEDAVELLALERLPDIDQRQTSACCGCSRCRTCLFAFSLVIVLWLQIPGKDSPELAVSDTLFFLSTFVTPKR